MQKSGSCKHKHLLAAVLIVTFISSDLKILYDVKTICVYSSLPITPIDIKFSGLVDIYMDNIVLTSHHPYLILSTLILRSKIGYFNEDFSISDFTQLPSTVATRLLGLWSPNFYQ